MLRRGLIPFLLVLGAAAPARADVDAGALRAAEEAGAVTFSQPGAPAATLRLAGTTPAGVTRTVERVGDGLIRVRLSAPAGTLRTGASFARVAGERFLGFGERSDAVVRDGGEVQHRVTEGPYQPVEDPFLAAFVPAAGYNTRTDATYFPVPWVLSTRGYGVLVEDDPTSMHRLGSPWGVDIEGDRLTLLVVAGPTPREVLRRFTGHVGRQPAVRPEALGAWWQVRNGSALSIPQAIARLQSADALGAVVQTSTHYLPCADHVAPGVRDQEREIVKRFEGVGLSNVTYFNPMICTSHPRYQEAVAKGLITKTAAGTPYEYRYTGASVFLVGQLDFRAKGAREFFAELLAEATADGHKGWMEDFGEYTPDDARAADGATGSGAHNAYPRDYHAAAQEAVGAQLPMRYVRSGWTGSAKSSPIVWGGDPTVAWGFDGLESAVRTGLSMGLSGVSRWGSDIGGFFALSVPQTGPELFNRWIQMGFASGIMRTQGNGFSLNGQVAGRRSEITDPEVLPTWSRYTQLRTRFLPELEQAEAQYDRDGLPVMRQLALAYPQDPRAVARDDQWLFGDDVLVAPVMRPGQTERELYLPPGRWVDVWRSADASLGKLRAAKVLDGGRDVTLPAPAAELPMLVRYGAALELLPTGGPTWRAAEAAGRTRRSILAFGGKSVKLSGERRRRYDLQWSVPRRPSAMRVGGKRVPFRFADGVVTATVRTKAATVSLVWPKRR